MTISAGFVARLLFERNHAMSFVLHPCAPFVEKFMAKESDTESSKAARARLTAVLDELNPASGKVDQGGGKANKAAKQAKRKAKAPAL